MKTNIRMIVQGGEECASDFAHRLELMCEELSEKFKKSIVDSPKVVAVSSSSDGRQTATIQFLTKDKKAMPKGLLVESKSKK